MPPPDSLTAARPPAPAAAPDWPAGLHRALSRAGVTQVGIVPDAGHAALIRLCEADPAMRVVRLTTEEEGIALAGGAWLGGTRGVVLMQSSGVGNCINMLSLPATYQLAVPMLITMRGEWGEFNAMQVPMGQATLACLQAMNVVTNHAERAEDVVEAAEATLNLAFNTWRPAATLIGQRVLGAKNFKELT
ncbi:thiamine pyrophosphate-binding protein [Frigidibacter sp. MR17.24]|uniref:thiamine pyrophosphate-binding protein n=1 Tax=Frigidibacter sp. MR17.24 TaxID=3127345 RepID=UPI003012BF7E